MHLVLLFNIFLIATVEAGNAAQDIKKEDEKPQADVWNNLIDEKPVIPPPRKLTTTSIHKQAWDLLQRNNAKTESKRRHRIKSALVTQVPLTYETYGKVEVTKEDVMKELRKMVKTASEERAWLMLKEKCKDCDGENLTRYMNEAMNKISRVPVAFTLRVTQNVKVRPGRTVLLQNLRLVNSALVRGMKTKNYGRNGKLTTERQGIYQILATLNFKVNHRSRIGEDSGGGDYITVMICLNGLCNDDSYRSKEPTLSTQYIHTLQHKEKFFTVQLTSIIQLKKTDYVSIYVKSNSNHRVLVLSTGTQVTGLQLGV